MSKVKRLNEKLAKLAADRDRLVRERSAAISEAREKGYSLDELAKELKVTRERVRQMERQGKRGD